MPGHATGTSSSKLVNASYHQRHEYIWFRSRSEWFLIYLGLLELVGLGHACGSELEPWISNFEHSCITIYQY